MKIPFNRTKIIATYGPACSERSVMMDMIKSGVNVFRFNFSHGDHAFHKKGFDMVHEINDTHNLNIAILADLQGPKIRVGKVEGDGVELKKGSTLEITNKEMVSTAKKIFISYDDLARDVEVGDLIMINDGRIELKVTETDGKNKVKAKVQNGGLLTDRKGVNLPNTKISTPSMTYKDKKDLAFAIENHANWVALSFVRSSYDVLELKEMIAKKNRSIKVISKIEKPEAVKEIDDIISASDAVMVARGDLGVEVPLERMPLIQKDIVNRCIKAARPVIIATQMMDSMIENPSPTRAEITDVANAVIDGADAVMLSGETSVGKHPVRVIQTMEKILRNLEKTDLIYDKQLIADKKSKTFVSDVICYNACNISEDLNAKAVIGMTVSGYTAFMVSSYRPRARIFIFTESKEMLKTLNILWGVKAFYYDRFVSTDVTIRDVVKILKKNRLVEKGDLIVNTASMPLRDQGRTNMVKVTVVK